MASEFYILIENSRKSSQILELLEFLTFSLKGVGDVSDGGGCGGDKLTGDY